MNSGSTCHQHRRHDASNCKPSADCLQRGGEVPMSADFEFKCSAVPSLDANDKFKRDSLRTVSFPVWCGELLNSVLRSRTFFAAYVVKAIRSPRTEVKSTSHIPYACAFSFGLP